MTAAVVIPFAAFAALIVAMVFERSFTKKAGGNVEQILPFVFISILVFSAVGIFLFVNSEYGKGAPVGLIKNPRSGNEWMLNIGGDYINNYSFGIQIPLYVVIFGIAGGYLRYLYKTAKLRTSTFSFDWNKVPGDDTKDLRMFLKKTLGMDWIKDEIEFRKEGERIVYEDLPQHSVSITIVSDQGRAYLVADNTRKEIFDVDMDDNDNLIVSYPVPSTKPYERLYKTLEDLSLLFLSPLLAIAVWLVLVQGGVQETTGTPMLAAVSFTLGLVTDDVIKALIGFVSSKLGAGQNQSTGSK